MAVSDLYTNKESDSKRQFSIEKKAQDLRRTSTCRLGIARCYSCVLVKTHGCWVLGENLAQDLEKLGFPGNSNSKTHRVPYSLDRGR